MRRLREKRGGREQPRSSDLIFNELSDRSVGVLHGTKWQLLSYYRREGDTAQMFAAVEQADWIFVTV